MPIKPQCLICKIKPQPETCTTKICPYKKGGHLYDPKPEELTMLKTIAALVLCVTLTACGATTGTLDRSALVVGWQDANGKVHVESYYPTGKKGLGSFESLGTDPFGIGRE